MPATCTKVYYTGNPSQKVAKIPLLEGERVLEKDNNKLGEMVLSELQPVHREIDVTFNIDSNGTLHTTAVQRATGISTSAKVQYSEKRLSEQEIERMIIDARRLNLDDQEKVQNAKARNDLESYCLDLQLKAKVNPKFLDINVIRVCQRTLDWLQEDHRSKDECLKEKERLNKSILK